MNDKIMAPSLTPIHNLTLMLRKKAVKGREKGSVGRCSICGLEEAANSKGVNDRSVTHAYVAAEKLVERAEKINKLLLMGGTVVGETEQFNGQLTWIAQTIMKARAEHEAYNALPQEEKGAPKTATKVNAPVYVDEHALTIGIRELLTMMGSKADTEKDPAKLLVYVKGNITLLLNQLKEAHGK
jgi:hypothetical protein